VSEQEWRKVPELCASVPILILDDDQACVEELVEMCESNGHEALGVDDPQEALDLMARRPAIGVVICDISMPRMNGFEVGKLLQERAEIEPAPELIIVSGVLAPENIVKTVRLGAADFLAKPIKSEDLNQALANALDRYRARLLERWLRRKLVAEIEQRGRPGISGQHADTVTGKAVDQANAVPLPECTVIIEKIMVLFDDLRGQLRAEDLPQAREIWARISQLYAQLDRNLTTA